MNAHKRLLARQPLFGTWLLDGRIGEGSYGEVYRLKREEFGQTYYAALKVITIPQHESELRQAYSEGMNAASIQQYFHAMVSELLREIRLMHQLKGTSNIVSYEDHQIVEWEKGHYDILIRMELLRSLTSIMQENMDTTTVVKLGIDICKALELCQKYSVIHRDIKPDNIFISQNGDFKLGDFGIARQLTHTLSNMSRKGTYAYMAPEVYKGEKYGTNVDLYSLSLVLYRLLNHNRAPFLPPYPQPIEPNSREQAMMLRLSGTPLPLPDAASGRLAEIVIKGASFNPSDRYETPQQMRADLEALYTAASNHSRSFECTPTPLDTSQPVEGAPYRTTARGESSFLYQPAAPPDKHTSRSGQSSRPSTLDETISLASHFDAPTEPRRRPSRQVWIACGLAVIAIISLALPTALRQWNAEKPVEAPTDSLSPTPLMETVVSPYSAAPAPTPQPTLSAPVGTSLGLTATALDGTPGQIHLDWTAPDSDHRLIRYTKRPQGLPIGQEIPLDDGSTHVVDIVPPGYDYEYRVEPLTEGVQFADNAASIAVPTTSNAAYAADGFHVDDFFLYQYKLESDHDRIKSLRQTDFTEGEAIGFCLDFTVQQTQTPKEWLVCWEVSANDWLFFDNAGQEALALPDEMTTGFLYYPIANSGGYRWKRGSYAVRVFIDGQVAAQGGFNVR